MGRENMASGRLLRSKDTHGLAGCRGKIVVRPTRVLSEAIARYERGLWTRGERPCAVPLEHDGRDAQALGQVQTAPSKREEQGARRSSGGRTYVSGVSRACRPTDACCFRSFWSINRNPTFNLVHYHVTFLVILVALSFHLAQLFHFLLRSTTTG